MSEGFIAASFGLFFGWTSACVLARVFDHMLPWVLSGGDLFGIWFAGLFAYIAALCFIDAIRKT